jgi:simple sugar transport system permease protein
MKSTGLFSDLFIDKIRYYKLQISITGVLILIFTLFISLNPKVFLGYRIYYSFMSTIPFFGIMAMAMTFVIILGEIDLSFPSVLAVSALIFGNVLDSTGYIWLAAFLALLFGVFAGFLNSLLIVRIGIPSIVATIGTMFFWRGAVNVIAEGKGISLVAAKDTIFYSLLVGRINITPDIAIPAQAIWFIVLGVFFYLLLFRHKFGSHVLFVGDNKDSSRMMGINVKLIKSIVYMQMGFFAAFVGIMSTLEVTYFWPTQGQGYLLTTLAAVFIGGTSVFGGRGTILGTIVGAIIIGSLEAGIIAIGLKAFWVQFVYGLIIIISVSIYAILVKKKE